ncbi:MAG: ATP-dependent DNA helicase [Candidatus Jorgensenbacteria bacterium]|nr:ATP-dependent DNA helicase [Candidatus Jorgensenbacteria bacterium]
MPKRDLYQELYKRLNKAQKQAVNTVEGPVMVIAGPGTGKTQILTLRIANILRETDTDPKSILALTFTESGVISMRKRLAEIMGDAAYAVDINTFHGFCNDIIKNYPEEFPYIIGSQNITEVEQIKVIEKLVEKLQLKELRPFGDKFYYVRAILGNLNSLKREGTDYKTFSDIVSKKEKAFPKIEGLRHEKGPHAGQIKGEYRELWKQISKNKELSKIYAAYQKELSVKRLYDYSDMIMEVLSALKNSEDLLIMLQERFQYFLVDEHQDTNNAQNKILELLAGFHANPNIFIVGDEKQAIFRFQGASLENFLYFKKLYPSAAMITLSENYRSTQQILDSAHKLATVMDSPGKQLNAQSSSGGKIRLCRFQKGGAELAWVAEDIHKKIATGAAPEEIAVLYRDNKDAFPIALALEKAGIQHVIESDQDIFDDTEIKKLIAILRAVSEFGSETAFIGAMHVDFVGLSQLDIYKIISTAGTRGARKHVLDVASSEETLRGIGVSSPQEIAGFYKKMESWTRTDKNKSLLSTFENIVRESGYLDHILKLPDPLAATEKLNAVFDEIKSIAEAKRNASLEDLFEYVTTLKEHNLYAKRKISGLSERRVRLMTAHKSKGQEFEHVYIINAHDGHWGNKRKSNILPLFPEIFSLFGNADAPHDEMSDERRLFYVALTRAKNSVTISYASESESGKERLPSVFVEEIKTELLEIVPTEKFERALIVDPARQFAESKTARAPDAERKLVRELFEKHGFSVTHLNNYLDCPWKYFYVNLLRIPQAQTKWQMYGTAVHEALRELFNSVKKGAKTSKQSFLKKFENALEKQPLEKLDLKETREKGRIALGGYYDAYSHSWSRDVLTELSIDGVKLAPGVTLTGKIDKLEFTAPLNEVIVVDYKTGKPKSRGEIEGETKNSSGDIKRQLIFYKLLLNRFWQGRYKMQLGVIDFVEPDEKGNYRQEKFEILDAKVKELEETIKQTANEIITMSFRDKTCGDKDCEFCALRKLIEK